MFSTVIVKVTETEFETDDGRVYPHPIPFQKGTVPSVKDFQVQMDRCAILFSDFLNTQETQQDDENAK